MVKYVELENCKGYTLRGLLDLPDGAKEIVVFLHGFTGNKTEHAGHFRNMARLLSKEGIASLRIDMHGNGESDGEFSDFVFEDALDDCYRMIDYAKEIEGIEKVDLLGFSMGGAMAGLVVDNTINKLVLMSPAGSMREHAIRAFEEWTKIDEENVFSAGFMLNKKYVDSIKKFDMYQSVGQYKGKCLIIQGTKDLAVESWCPVKYHELIKNSVLRYVEGSGHGYNNFNEREELYKEVIEFLKEA